MKDIRDSLEVFCKATTMIQSHDASISFVAVELSVHDNIKKSVGHKELNNAFLSNLKTRFDTFKNDQTYITAKLLDPCSKKNKILKYEYAEELLDEICGYDIEVRKAVSPI